MSKRETVSLPRSGMTPRERLLAILSGKLPDRTPFAPTIYKQCVADGMPGGRYVLGSACAVPARTPPENIAAARVAENIRSTTCSAKTSVLGCPV